ncbi:MAG TPA: nuclear transport factor 2 family protein [Thermoanaerobaculia bacterium]|nr:nuclear transport factor 2 family protein [Thermoanaerobaculia bacterium]
MKSKALRNTCLALAAAVFLATGATAQPRSGPAVTQELIDEITEKDRVFFDALFNKCDVETVGAMVTEDFEFYHDKGGMTASSRAQFVDSIREMCERQKTGVDYRARRELVSQEVYPLNNYGAVQVGVHRFYQKLEGNGEKLVEIAKFTNLWKKEGDAWRMSRVLSYDHKLTP